MTYISDFLKKREQEGLLRRLRPASQNNNATIRISGKEYIDFSSNDYLGIAGHPALKQAAVASIEKYGTGASASRLLSGDLEIHHELEEKTAEFKGKEAALVFNSGYQANTGIISALCSRGDAVFSDRLNHASIIDGIQLSGAKLLRFRHNDAQHLEELLKGERKKYRNALIITETIFSMDGDRPDLRALVNLKERYDCGLMVDEAHATGIYGKTGSGVVEEEGLTDRVDYIMGTFGKALGSFGAYLAATKETVDYLVNTSRSFIYSTALPPAVIACNLAALDVVKQEAWRREKLLKLAGRLREGLTKAGYNPLGSSQIVPVVIGENDRTVKMAEGLRSNGMWVLAIRPPTVPKGEARLRFSLSAAHTETAIDTLLKELKNARV